MDHMAEFETRSVVMRRVHLVEVGTPPEDVERILAAVTAVDPLAVGPRYDCVSFTTGPGEERYRPRDGAMAGAEEEVRVRPGPVFLSFEIGGGIVAVGAVVEAVFQAHSYQESTIRVSEVLSARSKRLDDRANPNRWWNTSGDWKAAQ